MEEIKETVYSLLIFLCLVLILLGIAYNNAPSKLENSSATETTIVEIKKIEWINWNQWNDALNVMGHYYCLDQQIKNAAQIVEQNLIGI